MHTACQGKSVLYSSFTTPWGSHARIMGTRGLIGFIIKGKRRATYNHFDSYPEGMGNDVIRFILSLDEDQIKQMQLLVKQVSPPRASLWRHLTRSWSGLIPTLTPNRSATQRQRHCTESIPPPNSAHHSRMLRHTT